YARAKEDGKISDDQADRWQKLADIPEDEFEERLRDPETKPSTSGLIKEDEPPSGLFKPTPSIPVPKLDANPRRCTASCCPEGSDIQGPFNRHDAQRILDGTGFEFGFFKEFHKAVLDFGVECRLERAFEQLRGGLVRGAHEIPERLHRYRGI